MIYRGTPFGDEIPVTHVEKVYEFDGMEKQKQKPTTQGAAPVEIEVKKHIVEKQWDSVHRRERQALRQPRPDHQRARTSILKEPLTDSDQKLFVSPGHRQNWLDCIKTRQRPICDVEIGARSVTVCHLVNLAYWHNRKLTWDPQKWEFPGDAEANGWRSRERRKGYELPCDLRADFRSVTASRSAVRFGWLAALSRLTVQHMNHSTPNCGKLRRRD